jgi:hypothetical protein
MGALDVRVTSTLLFAASLLVAGVLTGMWGFAPVSITFIVVAVVVALSTLKPDNDYFA